MVQVPPQLIPPLSIIALGIISFIVRWIAEFQLEGTGSDLALISTSLQLSLLFTRMHEGGNVTTTIVEIDVFFFLFLLILWAISIKIVQKALRNERKVIGGYINLYSTLAFIIGSIALSLEIFWRLQFV